MPKIQDNIAVNGNAGAFVNLSSTLWARKVTIMEDPVNGTAVGLDYQLPDDNFATTHKLAAGEQLVLGDTVAQNKGAGNVIGRPAQNDTGSLTGTLAASVYAKVRSTAAGVTKARMTETE